MTQNKTKAKSKTKKFFKRFWWLLWKDDSFKGWIFSVVFLFLFIKFIFFPFLTLATGTSMPLAIVESCSMYHEDGLFSTASGFDLWWETHENKYDRFEIEKEEFKDFSLRKGFNKGDILFLLKANPEKLEVGDIIIFNANQRNPVIHRIVEIKEKNGEKIFSTLGDNNPDQINFEKEIKENQIIGKASFRLVPYAGWIKLMFYDWKKPSSERGLC